MVQGDKRRPLELAVLAHVTANLVVAARVVVWVTTQVAIDLSSGVPLFTRRLLVVRENLIDHPVIAPQNRSVAGLRERVKLGLGIR